MSTTKLHRVQSCGVKAFGFVFARLAKRDVRPIIAVIVLLLCGAAHAAKPNVLFIMSDDLNNAMGTYGADVKTPNLDRLAARGVRFDRAYCQFPLCGPSRCSLMSGMRPDKIGVLTNGRPVRYQRSDVVTLPQLFRQNGYVSARVGKIYHLGIPGDVGKPGPDDPASWDSTYDPPGAEFTTDGDEYDPTPERGQGFRRVLGKGEGVEQADYQAADEAIRLLNQHKDRPFFVAVGFIRPHVPVIAPKKYFEMHSIEQVKLPQVPPDDRADIPAAAFMHPDPNWGMSESDCLESKRAYLATISFMDAQAGRVLDELEKLGLAENTVVVFVSDHGYLLGEHHAWQKQMLFEPVSRVPLLMAGPGVTRGASKSIVELIDLYPTLAELAGLIPPKEIDGVSLAPVLKDANAIVKPAAFTQLRRKEVEGRTVRTDRWRYTEWNGGEKGVELYDHENDPREFKNLAEDPRHAETVKKMKEALTSGVQGAAKSPG